MGTQHASTRRLLVLVIDGLGDLPSPALGGATPLEAAATPTLDRWAAEGLCGLVDPVAPGTVVETHVGTATLMGLSAGDAASLTRGPIEAAGAAMELREGDVALRCNFATLDPGEAPPRVLDRRAGRIRDGTEALALAVNAIAPEDGVTTFLAPLDRHRAVLRLSGVGLSAAITDTDPGVGGRPQALRPSRAVEVGDASGVRTAAALNRFLQRASAVMEAHPVNRARRRDGLPPANGLLTRGAGRVRGMPGVLQGLRGAVVASDRTVLGLGGLLGFTLVSDPAFTGLLDTDLDEKLAAARRALETHDIVWLHVKGTDIAAHDRQPEAKRAILERLDTVLAGFDVRDLVVGVAGDHTTDSNTGSHTSDPVPALAYVPGGRHDDVAAFGESACMRGGLGRLRSEEFLRVLLGAAGMLPGPLSAPEPSGTEEKRTPRPGATRSRDG